MLCEEVQHEMMKRTPRSFEPNEHPAFEAHLAECGACRSLYQTLVLVEQAAAERQEEEVPAWDRLASLRPFRPQPKPLLQWLPLAACLVLTLLTVTRVEIEHNASGWHVRFGGAHAQVQALAATQQAENAKLLRGLMLEYDRRQSKNLETVTAQITQTLREERTADLARMIESYTTQRDKDMDWVQARFESLLYNQQKTQHNLNRIADYVTRVPSGKP